MRALARKTLAIIIVVALVVIAAAALIYQFSKAPAPEKVKLVLIGPFAGAEYEAFKPVIERFMAEYPHIEVEYKNMRPEDLAPTAPLQFEAGQTPGDVIMHAWAWWIKDMGEKGHLLDLSGLVNVNEYIPGVFDPVTSGGKIYGLPFTAFAKPGFWYRKSFFEAHGLKEPKTWDEFVQLLDKIKTIPGIVAPIASGDGVGWPLSDVTEHFIIAFGGPELQLKLINGTAKFTDPNVREIFEKYLVPLIKNRYFAEPTEWSKAVEEWWAGKYGIYFMGTWITGMVPDPNDLSVFPLPGTRGVVMGMDYVFVPKYTKHPEEAKLLAKWLATEGQKVHVGTKAGKFATWLKVGVNDHWEPMRPVYNLMLGGTIVPVPDLDDAVGGDWQKLFWDQLKLLWVSPDRLDEVLNTLATQFPKK